MSGQKTKPEATSVGDFIDALADEGKREDSRTLVSLLEEVSGEPPVMWGPSMVGFGSYDYKYESGHSGTYFLIGFSPRSKEFSLYGFTMFDGADDLLARLGKHRTGKSCLYIKGLAAVDADVLREMAVRALEHMRTTNHIHD